MLLKIWQKDSEKPYTSFNPEMQNLSYLYFLKSNIWQQTTLTSRPKRNWKKWDLNSEGVGIDRKRIVIFFYYNDLHLYSGETTLGDFDELKCSQKTKPTSSP